MSLFILYCNESFKYLTAISKTGIPYHVFIEVDYILKSTILCLIK